MNYLEEMVKGLQQDNKYLRMRVFKAETRNGTLFVLSLVGWALLVVSLALPQEACASERWSSTVIRCQQSSDTCIKKESVHYTEQDCDRENAKVVEAIGPTDDVVIAFCQSGN